MTQQTTPDFGEIKVVKANQRTVSQPVATAIVQPEIVAPKKRSIARFWWVPLLLIAGIAAANWGHNYYNQRYVGADYWAQVPATQDTTLVESISDSGQAMGVYGVTYVLTAFNEAGESRQVDFVYHADDEASVPLPGDYLWISASPTIVVRQHVVATSEVPANVREQIAANAQ